MPVGGLRCLAIARRCSPPPPLLAQMVLANTRQWFAWPFPSSRSRESAKEGGGESHMNRRFSASTCHSYVLCGKLMTTTWKMKCPNRWLNGVSHCRLDHSRQYRSNNLLLYTGRSPIFWGETAKFECDVGPIHRQGA